MNTKGLFFPVKQVWVSSILFITSRIHVFPHLDHYNKPSRHLIVGLFFLNVPDILGS